ncbi:uncharacterized protein LOC112576088 [Pomacea canaliculata]|uniref:uncharacterized protein LOC112576088 n=1 Tax=Pomacea canaliculata TaxID=400727 RepID=UPI000D73F2E4|nr:uncharacterized protein LOC112576088 [Pomacea canaliculata]
MLSHLVSDITPGLRITKTIAFPNLTADQVQQAISEDIPLTENLCRCLGTSDPAAIPGLCLCCDQLSDPQTPCDVSSHVLRELGHWWQRRVAGAGPDSRMTDVVYKMLVARFCGPATTVSVPCTCPPRVSVKTLGQAVWWTGECYTAVITLFPEQVQLLNKASPRVFVAGPPGTGKTVVLLLMAIEWLRCGHHVYVISTWWGSRAACSMLYHLLLQTVKKQLAPEVLASQLHLLHVNLNGEEKVEKAVNDLSQAASGGSLYVLIDEIGHEDKAFMEATKMKHIQTFCEKLLAQVPRLHLWAASCYHKNCPPGWRVEYLTRPLRSPPAVVREIKKDTVITKGVSIKKYSERGVPDHTDGPPVTRVSHRGQGHSGHRPGDCVTCGREVASFLHSLRVGVTEINELTTVNTVTSTTCGTPPCLQWRDVLVLNWGYFMFSGMVTGLQEAGIPVRVMEDDDIEDVATARSDVVWVADGELVRGLERKVVVCLQYDYRSLYGDVTRSEASRLLAPVRSDSFHSISRCTSQLVIVE